MGPVGKGVGDDVGPVGDGVGDGVGDAFETVTCAVVLALRADAQASLHCPSATSMEWVGIGHRHLDFTEHLFKQVRSCNVC